MPKSADTTPDTGSTPDVTPEQPQTNTPTGEDAAGELLKNLSPEVLNALAEKLAAMMPQTPEPPQAPAPPVDPKAEALKRETAYLQELVQIELFKDNDKYKADLPVGYNGKLYVIQRGKPVMVPRAVAQIVEAQLAQDKATSMLIEREASEYAAEAEKHGI